MTQMGDSIRRRRRGLPRAAGGEGARASGSGERRARPRWGRWILGGLLGTAASFCVGWLIAVFVLFPEPALAGDEVAVPGLEGLTVEEAREEAAAVQLRIGDVREMIHPSARRGDVVAQDPLPGQTLRPGAEVHVAVSQGRARVTVPELVGMPADAALELARRLGFDVERMDQMTAGPAGEVLRTAPSAGARVELPAPLLLVVSQGGLRPVDSLPAPGAGAAGEPVPLDLEPLPSSSGRRDDTRPDAPPSDEGDGGIRR